ncbi:MAG: hydroxymethylglutaryl-CoA lyase [Bdellovibrionales bacterium]|nr:hydroxymethylglutaryl-CoA lyase [Bdellovibrionales bacterium]MBT3526286.1 hydroxymethylglutaryl-CoA lyase [Bdellovibrionales bacterium]MBT7670195.1 hydroxymethylglutaryl-CoA lyase [Bdellovibrionales bacterium]MBT7765873.1 hydroxymethylglutaryl-CoA lyase [Bdellovibrionales bacterium]
MQQRLFTGLPKKIKIVEVGPRDGLQNESAMVSVEDKIKFITLLAQAGLQTIEVASFVHPDRVPQMGNSGQVVSALKNLPAFKGVELISLVPNLKGLEYSIAAGSRYVAFFTSNSETFNRKNINATIEESLHRIEMAAKMARDHSLRIRGYISTAFGCPYEGETSIDALKRVAEKLLSLGAEEICIADTAGLANPNQVQQLLENLKKSFDLNQLAIHLHDTAGLALPNAMVALQEGITAFDTSAAGLGGCPFAKGASGNLATEDLLNLANKLGIDTGVETKKLLEASTFILDKLGNQQANSKFFNACRARSNG